MPSQTVAQELVCLQVLPELSVRKGGLDPAVHWQVTKERSGLKTLHRKVFLTAFYEAIFVDDKHSLSPLEMLSVCLTFFRRTLDTFSAS